MIPPPSSAGPKALVLGVGDALFMVETVDSTKLASILDRACAAAGRAMPLRVLIQARRPYPRAPARLGPGVVASRVASRCRDAVARGVSSALPLTIARGARRGIFSCCCSARLCIFRSKVNTSGEAAKSGVPPTGDALLELARHIHGGATCPHLALAGLMTIGALGAAEGAPSAAECFAALAAARDHVAADLGLGGGGGGLELSMGMSGDFEEAVAQGSTSVRVGSTIFGARNYANK